MSGKLHLWFIYVLFLEFPQLFRVVTKNFAFNCSTHKRSTQFISFFKSLLFYSSKNLHKYAVTQMTYRYMPYTPTLKTYQNKAEIIYL